MRFKLIYRWCRCAAVLIAVATLAACGAVAGARALVGLAPAPAKPGWTSVTLAAAADANADSALAVDIVLVKDKAMLESLAAMSAAKYFGARADLQRTFPDALSVLPIEITPGQQIRIDGQRFGKQRAWAALVFANYATPGEHRLRLLLDHPGYVLHLNAQEFIASDIKPGSAR
ncbi:hypothetical protein F2P44_28455 [Massilia sp. CCM 8695]|uniref:Type VI secretion system lipoprotein TssJ n=1 Tax=Massilia frigida TaxID=2609281 RepID=A0ABX0NCK7_9BURK|nr:hypothetical protein [Massilia frigida]NHZ83176.1 hypothetical protein [Massilia frigida]